MVASSIDSGLAKLHVSPAIEASSDLESRVERATSTLMSVLGSSAGSVEAQWDTEPDSKGRTLLRLQIRDFTGEAVARFAPVDIDNELQLRRRLYSLWGDLLQKRSETYLRQLHETVANLSGE